MGYYIDTDSKGKALDSQKKAQGLIDDGATIAEKPVKFQENLICVVKTASFDAAGYCFSENEFEVFNDPNDYRPRTWLIHPDAKKLAGYKD